MSDFPYASRFTRLIGQIVDGFIGAAAFVVVAPLAAIIGLRETTTGGVIAAILFAIASGWWLFYYLFSDGFTGGQSYAKRMFGMHVIDAKTRTPCSFGQSFLRNLLLLLLGPIDAIFIFGERRQRLGDMVAGTVVISERS